MKHDHKKRICILFGGVSPEHEVSLSTATSILNNIDRSLFKVLPVGITKDGKWYLYTGDVSNLIDGTWETSDEIIPAILSPVRGEGLLVFGKDGVSREKIDCVFPALHGENGEDGSMQGLCSIAGIPCVGAMVAASAVSMDKVLTKAIVSQLGIRQAEYEVVYRYQAAQGFESIVDRIESALSYPVFVKPSNTGSSVGIRKVKHSTELVDAIVEALRYSDKVLVEEFIDGREIEVAVLGNSMPEASVCGEIKPGDEFYTYEDKYINGVATLHIPADLPDDTSEKVRQYACKIYSAIGCAGLSRVDFFVHKTTGEICFNEINTLPGFTPISMYPKLWEYCGIPYPELITRLISLALEE